MSESSATASTGAPALPDADALADGLSIERVFSSEDTHPFDELDWDRRTAAIKNPDGEAIFEQEDVEFPSSWSQLATNVVASKYFYGDQDAGNGSPADGQREYSVKQLVERVTRTIADWGRAQDYFATEEDAETFYEELTWLCVNQYGAFNSPVWFNVGLGQQYGIRDTGDKKIYGWDDEAQAIVQVDPYEHPQASACFIVDVEDSIDGIWRTMRACTSGRLASSRAMRAAPVSSSARAVIVSPRDTLGFAVAKRPCRKSDTCVAVAASRRARSRSCASCTV